VLDGVALDGGVLVHGAWTCVSTTTCAMRFTGSLTI
jgi:hypothetical protein